MSRPPLKICHVTYGYFPKAGQSTMFEYARAEASFGHDVSVIAIKNPAAFQLNKDLGGVNVFSLDLPPLTKPATDPLRFVWRAQEVINEHDFDIVHIYSNVKFFAPLLPLRAGRKRKRQVWIRDFRSTVHNTGRKGQIFRKILNAQGGFFDGTFADSEGTRDDIFGADREDIFIARQGANLRLFRHVEDVAVREGLGISSDQMVLILTGNLQPVRKLHLVVEAIKLISNQFGNKVVLLLLGDGLDKERLVQLTKEMGIEKQVIFTGLVDYEKVPEYLSSADIGFAYVPIKERGAQPPLKTAEMLACGLPVVATNTRGNRHFIKDDVNGLLVEDNPEAMAKGLIKLINDGDMRQRFRERARKSVEQYDYKNTIEKFVIPQYYKLLQRKRANL